MTQEDTGTGNKVGDNNPIRRKLSGPAGPFDMPGVTLAKTIRQAVVRGMQDCLGLEVSVTGFAEEEVTLADIAGGIAENDLIFVTEGPNETRGLRILDGAAVSGFLEQMVTGRVVPGNVVPRVPTRTDASILCDVMNLISERIELGLKQVKSPPPIASFQSAGTLEDARAVSLALEDVSYRMILLSLDMAQGSKTATIRLIFPWTSGLGSAPRGWGPVWQDAVKETHVAVEAVLLRLPMSIEDISALRVGDLVPVPVAAVGEVSLEGSDHRCVGTGRLGQSNGFRAVRLIQNDAATLQPQFPAAGQVERPAAQSDLQVPADELIEAAVV